MKRKTAKRAHAYRSRMTRDMVFKYFLSLAVFAAVLLAGVLIAYNIVTSITWQPGNLVYRALKRAMEYPYLAIGVPFFAGWAAITYYFMARPLWYLDELIAAAERLAAPDAQQITLPPAMKNAQDQLNLFREQAFHSALLAKEAEQRKNDLIVYLAHDLKTPLTSVIGYLTLLQDEPQISQELRAKYTGIALKKAQRLEELMNEFFEITRFNLTSIDLAPEQTNLSRMLEQLLSEFEPILTEKRLTWKAGIEPGVELLCDRDKMERVLDNLIQNSIHYCHPDTPIAVSLRKDGPQAEIRVENQGKTLPPQTLDRIFDQFFRVDSSRSSSSGGAGLGLAIAKEIVEHHGGTIGAESENGHVAFLVRLPLNCQKTV